MPTLVDHILVFLIAVALPVYAFYSYKTFQRQTLQKIPSARKKAYYETILLEWSLTSVLIILWLILDRPVEKLGLNFPLNPRLLSGMLLALCGCAFFVWQWIQVLKLEEIPESLKEQIEPVKAIMPHTPEERKLFVIVAITAGICEELLYRGFLIWYVEVYSNWMIAAIVSIVIFGLGHSYQGTSSMLKTMVLGMIMVALYLLSGSLIPPILLHIVVDLSGGFIGYEVVKTQPQSHKELELAD